MIHDACPIIHALRKVEVAKKIHIRTFGCQMNVHDSERMLGAMLGLGWEATDEAADADLIVVNTCSVREKAYHKVRSALGALKPLSDPRRVRRPIIVVAGCVARQEGERWLDHCPHIDIVLGPDAVSRLATHVGTVMDGGPPVVDVAFDEGRARDFLTGPGRATGPTAYVTVMKGCSHHCTFCIVPSVRGPMRHRPSVDIIHEVQCMVDDGAREITLLGQTVNAWCEPGSSPDEGRDFAWLLGRLDRVAGLARLRYTSPHPIYVTDALVMAHASLASLCEHVHLPVQSGSDRILRRMGRRHDRDHYLRVTDALRDTRPGFCLSTDLIVGFPGETSGDHSMTLDLVERVGFDTFFSFMYSERPGTPAVKLVDDVEPEVKRTRLHELHALGDRLTAARYSADVGRVVQVLVEGESRSGGGQLSGRTRTNRIVNFHPSGLAPTPGDLVEVTLTDAMPHCLLGES